MDFIITIYDSGFHFTLTQLYAKKCANCGFKDSIAVKYGVQLSREGAFWAIHVLRIYSVNGVLSSSSIALFQRLQVISYMENGSSRLSLRTLTQKSLLALLRCCRHGR